MTSCPEGTMNEYVTVFNNSDIDVFIVLGLQDSPDTCISNTLPKDGYGIVVDKNSSGKIGFMNYIPTCDSIKVFVLDNEIVNTHSWEEIRESDNILKRYDLTFSILKKKNWTVTYP